MRRQERVVWIEMADGSEMGDFAGYKFDDLDEARSTIEIELAGMAEAQDDDPEGDHVCGVRVIIALVQREVVVKTKADLDALIARGR